MNITPPILATIAARFRDNSKPKLNQAQLAEHMGYGRSWASKLMKGNIKALSDEDSRKMERFLDIKLQDYFQEHGDPIPDLAVRLGQRIKNDEAMTRVIAALMDLPQGTCAQGTRWIPTQDMTKIGQEIIRICFANEDKPGKVARLVLELLA